MGDVRQDGLERSPFPTIYVDYRQRPQATFDFNVVIRVSTNPAAAISAARQIVRNLDPTVPPQFTTLAEVVSSSVQSRRFNLALVGIFAATALLLALAGMYGVMAYSVTRRTNEIGVRMALGASRRNVLGLVLGQGLLTAGAGVVIGTFISLAVTRALKSLLFGLSPADPLTFAAVIFMLVAVTMLACFVPALRACRIDPMVALRYE